MSRSNFEKVIDFNRTFGITVYDTIQQDIFDKDPKLIKYRMDLIREEVKELTEAVEQHDFIELIDALADILYVVYGMGCSIGADLDESFEALYKKDDRILTNFEIIKASVSRYPTSPLSDDKLFFKYFNNLQLNEIIKELYQLETFVANKMFLATTISLTRLINLSYSAGLNAGVDMDEAYRLVHESNMSKSCVSEEEAQETVKWYEENEERYDSPAYRLADNGEHWIVYNKSTKKILKSINYHPVDLKQVCYGINVSVV